MSDDKWWGSGPEDPADDFGGRRSRRPDNDHGHDIPNVEVIFETGRAIKVRGLGLSTDPFGLGDVTEEAWIPLSQIHSRSEVRNVGDKGLLVITTWLAEQKGLV